MRCQVLPYKNMQYVLFKYNFMHPSMQSIAVCFVGMEAPCSSHGVHWLDDFRKKKKSKAFQNVTTS